MVNLRASLCTNEPLKILDKSKLNAKTTELAETRELFKWPISSSTRCQSKSVWAALTTFKVLFTINNNPVSSWEWSMYTNFFQNCLFYIFFLRMSFTREIASCGVSISFLFFLRWFSICSDLSSESDFSLETW